MIRLLFFVLLYFTCLSSAGQDTLNSFFVKKNPPYLYSAIIKHKDATIKNKMVRGTIYSFTYNVVIGTGLTLSSEQITKWSKEDKFTVKAIKEQYERTFATAPVIDKDLAVVNYLGHPYQGSIYYNSLRCQGANEWQSALLCLAHSTLWEYAWEGGVEQPSIQDLIITPAAGILLGELSHVLTIKMSRDGFKWYEVSAICLLNPMYAINNGFKVHRNRDIRD